MSKPVMTDGEIRAQFLNDLATRVEDFKSSARRERCYAASLVPGQGEAKAEYMRYASHYDRHAAHYQQAIDLLTAAPMPAEEETVSGQIAKDWDFIDRVANPGARR